MTILRRCIRFGALVAMVFAIAALVATPRHGVDGVGIVTAHSHADGEVRPLGLSVVALANLSAVAAAPVVVPLTAPIDSETASGFELGTTRRAAIRAWKTSMVKSEGGDGRSFDRTLARVDRC